MHELAHESSVISGKYDFEYVDVLVRESKVLAILV